MQGKLIRHAGMLLCTGFLIFLVSCSGRSSERNSVGVQDNGLTPQINNFVPDSLLDAIEALGMPVNRGDNPPNIQGYFRAAPFILLNSNRPSDIIGQQYGDYYVRFYNQNNRTLAVNTDYVNGPEAGVGLGSFIVGTADSFSVFSQLTVKVANDSAYLLVLYSGNMMPSGISNMHTALFMLDDLGDPSNYFIENNDGRIFYDNDLFSEEISGFPKKSWPDEATRSKMTSAQGSLKN